MLTVYIDKPATRELLIQRFHIKPENVKTASNPKSTVDRASFWGGRNP